MNLIRFTISNGGEYSDETVLRLLEIATTNLDAQLDARKLIPSNPSIPQLYTITEDLSNSAINSLPENTDGVIVPMGITAQSGNFTITPILQTLETGRRIYLTDNNNATEIEIKQGVGYNFYYAGGTNNNRFELRFEMNHAPIVNVPLEDKSILEDAEFIYTMPAETFTDIDEGDIINYQAHLFSETAMPEWLNFNNITQTFTGTPKNENVGTYTIEIIATDSYDKTVSQTFDIEVINVNDAPYLNIPIEDNSTLEDAEFIYTMPAETFADIDEGDIINYQARLLNETVMPEWLSFNHTTKIFSGTPENENVGTYTIEIIATDSYDETVSDVFDIKVINVNDAPYLNISIEDVIINANENYQFSIANNTFIDVDENDILRYNTSETGSSILPSWLSFNNEKRTFFAEPTNIDVGEYSILVEAIDQLGAYDTDEFMITVIGTTNINDLNNNITISPNPTSGIFNINVNQNIKDKYVVLIYDNTGKRLMEINTSNKTCEIDLSEYALGIYSLSIIIGDKIYHKKVILK